MLKLLPFFKFGIVFATFQFIKAQNYTMFMNSQYHIAMKDLRYIILSAISLITLFIISSCSTTSSLPYDDVYYSSKDNVGKQPASTLSEDVYKSSSSTGDYQSYYKGNESEVSQVPVGAGAEGNQQYSSEGNSSEDIYYDSDYESRIKRFNNEGSSLGYYDDYYTDGNACGCGNSNSNWSFSVGIGAGYGWGWSMGYGYGWPYYGWGYPYYGWGYPYYGGSYWAGYNNGYWNGYWDGYYGYPGYGGGYYPDYGYGYGSTYRPRNGRGGGSNVPRTGERGSSGITNPAYREKTVVAGGSGFARSGDNGLGSGGGSIGGGNQGNSKTRPAESIRVKPVKSDNKSDVRAKNNPTDRKPVIKNETGLKTNTGTGYRKPVESSKTDIKAKPRYEKPKSYRTLPAQQARSGKEYVAPKRNTQPKKRTSNTAVRSNTRKPLNQPNTNYNRSSSTRSRSNSAVKSRTNTRSRTTTTRTRSSSSRSSSSPSRSYSSPSRSSASSSRSYSSPTRSSGSSGGGSRSSSSRSGSRGGGHR
jgi:hypothetical protein